MEDIFWEVFKKSGDIEAFLAYKEFNTNKNSNEKFFKNSESNLS